jgi:Effector-associated domain 5
VGFELPMTSPSSSTPPAKGKTALLDHERVLQLHRVAISADLAANRDSLLAGLPSAFVATLRRSPAPAEQTLEDLTALNQAGQLPDNTVPLAVWLQNAIALRRVNVEISIFEQALTEIRASTGLGAGGAPIHSHREDPASAPRVKRHVALGLAIGVVAATLLSWRFTRSPNPPGVDAPSALAPATPAAPGGSGRRCADTANLRGSRLEIEADGVLSFDLLDLNRFGVLDVVAGGHRHTLRRDGLQVLELRKEKGPVHLTVVAGTDRKGQSLHMLPDQGTLTTRIGLSNGTDASLESAIELYVSTVAAVDILRDVRVLRIDGENACWEASRLRSLRLVDGELEASR